MKLVTFALPQDAPAENKNVPLVHVGTALKDVVIDFATTRRWASHARRLPLEPFAETLFDLIRGG